ncbi:TPA: hypothetical protein DEO28_00840 [Candidatus Dependentiae bacterium]|nr:MAG: hypothetical protein UR14_C0003G0020 [candidate division TM6 bacterium GW2011_GWE2_31_21]KKP54140.1 MAG: hypothetical protein UR43_C0001G0158 [candidate division TM6 bacterium GW2011_GWF2_33_332]HBS47861.1 hypothetical protein [Candidatus Dependentiae bacterium]HBZ73046.1 hypothetical protein [Candidatus Dependentiae bacterium]
MMKSASPVLIVDSVAVAVKFYTDKLSFDIVSIGLSKEGHSLNYAELKKGKATLMLLTPTVEEMVEFSQIKHLANRSSGAYFEMKKGIEKYFERCKTKGVQIIEGLKDTPWGHKVFKVRDPFGFKLAFAQPMENFKAPANSFCGISIDLTKDLESNLDRMIVHVRGFGLSRRAAKKYAKSWLKALKKSR